MMRKKQMKGFGGLAILGIIALVAIVTTLFVPGVSSSLQSIIGVKQACIDAPFDPTCICADDEERLNFIAFGVPKFVCEPINKFIDPNDVDWQQQSIDYAESVLEQQYPDCTSRTCESGNWRVTLSAENYENRVILVECLAIDQRFASVWFYVKDGSFTQVGPPSCGNYYEPQPGNPAITINYDRDGPGYDMVVLKYRIDCNVGTGTAAGSYTYELPYIKSDSSSWWFHGIGYPQSVAIGVGPSGIGIGSCTLENAGARSVTVDCVAECTGYGGYGGEITLRWYTAPFTGCGNGIIESGEQCDDGNLIDGDGCSSVCTIQ